MKQSNLHYLLNESGVFLDKKTSTVIYTLEPMILTDEMDPYQWIIY